MKFPESWLRQHIQTDAGHDTLSACLTAIGLEVEDDTPIGAVLTGVVVAEILSLEKHPEADRLNVCQVATGSGTVQIVCGAPNARAGLKAPLAQIGAELPGGFAIKAAKLRGIDSAGMLCSAKELGIDADASGLLELPADAPVGTALADYLGLPDARFELKLTPNRADCFSIRGIAFDLAAALQTRVVPMQIPEVPVTSGSRIEVKVAAETDCPRYCGRVIEGLNPNAVTPLWMSEALKRSGIRPLSPLVDITQFVMLELGQPMHAFDADKLTGPIGVRRALAGESCGLLDGKQAELSPEFTVITDADRAIAVAGVMGGLDTSVSAETTRVFLESAHFAPESIIGRARKLGLHTDASHRFERGVDPALPALALERASALVLEILGGQAGPVVLAESPQHIAVAVPVLLRRQRLARVLGIAVDDARVQQILLALGMQVAAVADGWQVTAPSRRFDIAIEEDLIEEIARIVGYEQIPMRTPSGEVPLVARSESALDESALRSQLIALDIQETINYAFVDAALLDTWQLQAGALALANPLSAEMAVMRTSLLPGLVSTLTANAARQQTRLRLFEIGRVFTAQGTQAPLERQCAAAVLCGPSLAEQWSSKPGAVDFYDARAAVDAALARLGFQASYRPAHAAYLHPGRSAVIEVAGKDVGLVGALHPALNKALDLPGDVYAFELDLSALPPRALPSALPVSRFPSVRRDLALVVPESVQWAEIEACVRQTLGDRLQSTVLFDVYRGAGLPESSKSLAIGLILHEFSRTLNDSEIETSISEVLASLANDCQAVLRG
ncbi:phenylalanine--tRNA ligase subunit beta [Arenimonas sp. GDDSR-1]|uniref:phenylalanine--tRNA ligase subunit beta n=1 Tax=Arenimonas sp. GDDSR-1 TaxID=2950125 RepID=UPI0026202E74|nr:phenylalanine--tRNA ligase subunit beta [Arenimonas sp. GDDSR-1]